MANEKLPPLEDIQANILKPHGRDVVKLIFLSFKDDDNLRETIIHLVKKISEDITSAQFQNSQAAFYKNIPDLLKERYDYTYVKSMYLSASFYKKVAIDKLPKNPIFKNGMRAGHRGGMNDPEMKEWGGNYQYEQIGGDSLDVMILIASNNVDILNQREKEITESKELNNVARIFTEEGRKLFYRDGKKKISIEPFGFRDGIGGPYFFKQNEGQRNELIPDMWKLVLDDQYGSYLVYRKLEQDVAKFNQEIGKLAKHLNITRELAEAQVIGRFKDGTPLSLFDSPSKVQSEEDYKKIQDFDDYAFKINELGYKEDPDGSRCPFHAHIRKVNPRNKTLNISRGYGSRNEEKEEAIARMVRRGIPYSCPGGKVGLLFLGFQKSLLVFKHMQGKWANDPEFNPVNTDENQNDVTTRAVKYTDTDKLGPVGLDPIIGQPEEDEKIKGQNWNKKWGGNAKKKFDFRDVVKFRGGEYFYAPRISFFRDL